MTKVSFLLISMLLSISCLFAQTKVGKDGQNMNSCDGAINIFENGTFSLAFNGGGADLSEGYPTLAEVDSKNTLWCAFIAPSEGTLSFDASVDEGFLQMVIFKEATDDICSDINNGYAEMQRMLISKQNSSVGLSTNVGSERLYTLPMVAGEKIYLVFATNADSEKSMALQWQFKEDVISIQEQRIVDKRDDDFAPTLSLLVRDATNGKPLTASLVMDGNSDLQGMYIGSDFFFNVTSTRDIILSCDLEGYFFYDSIIEISRLEDKEIEIQLERASAGKSLQIEEIQFAPGTSEILKSSEPKLRRLKDFLALNTELEVEIQGHVFAIGNNSFAGQRISEARAKRVMKYLIDNGIDRSRLSSEGYGNTKPIYPNPERTFQEQANRRVEILIK